MYLDFYGLSEKPFNLTPDPRFLFLSKKHKEAFAHLMYGIRHRSGFVMVSGEIGTGKTTICRSLLKDLDPDIEIALVFNPYLSPRELLKRINQDFGIESESSSILELIDELNTYLLERAREGKNCVLIIDEAQDLNADVLEQIRLLSNLETEKEKLLQIMLIGQPELAEKLELHELRQLNQRITARYHLDTLSEEETLHYVAFRLRVAGGRKKVRFSRKAIREVYRYSGGTPRVINALCDRALLIGYTQELREITPNIVKTAAKEVQGLEHVNVTKLDIASILRTGGVLSSAAVIVLLMVLATSGQLPLFNHSQSAGLAESAASQPPVMPNQVDATELPENIHETSIEDPLEVLDEHMDPRETPTVTKDTTGGDESGTQETIPEVTPEANTNPKIEIREVEVAESTRPDPESTEPTSEPQRDVQSEPQDEPEKIVVTSIPKPVPAEPAPRTPLTEAMTALFTEWNHNPRGTFPTHFSADAAVAYLRDNNFSVANLSASVQQVILLNRPALLLTSPGAGEQWVALTAYDSGICTITTANGEERQLGTNDLASIYRDRALVPWRDATPGMPAFRLLNSGENIWALQHDLVELGLLHTEPSGVYDTSTESVVREIQRICGLDVDGIFGSQTRLALGGWLGRDTEPTLSPVAFPLSTQNALMARLPEPEVAIIPEPESKPETIPVETEPEPTDPGSTQKPPAAQVGVESLDSPETGAPDYEPILPPRQGPSNDSVTEPAEVIVPLKPSRNFNNNEDES